ARHLLELDPIAASFVGYSCSVAVSYLGNARLTFRRDAMDTGQFTRFVVISLLGLLVNQLIVLLLVGALHYPFWLALGAVVLSVPPLTFVLSRRWAFQARPSPMAIGPEGPDRS